MNLMLIYRYAEKFCKNNNYNKLWYTTQKLLKTSPLDSSSRRMRNEKEDNHLPGVFERVGRKVGIKNPSTATAASAE